VRAHTLTDPDARAAGFGAARDLARRQGAPLFELRAALDDFELRGQPARQSLIDAAGRLVSDSPLPELARTREILGSDDLRIGPAVSACPDGCGADVGQRAERGYYTRKWAAKGDDTGEALETLIGLVGHR